MNINICGVNILKNKIILFGLIKIYGIGLKTSKKICKKFSLFNKRFFELKKIELIELNKFINSFNIENKLRILKKEYMKKILELNSYKSFRHKKKLPCRGQKTKNNAKTRKKMIHEII